jgi:hypothetical protein
MWMGGGVFGFSGNGVWEGISKNFRSRQVALCEA